MMPISFVKRVAKSTLSLADQLAERAWRSAKRAGTVVLCPPIPEENLGDQAMVMAVVDTLIQKEQCPVILVATGPRKLTRYVSPNVEIVDAHEHFSSGSAYLSERRFRNSLTNRSRLVLIGADILDETYGERRSHLTLDAVLHASKRGVSCRILSFSVSCEPSPTLASRLRQLSASGVRLLVRDPHSYARLAPLLLENLELSADVALLLKPCSVKELSDETKDFVCRNHGSLLGLTLTDGVLYPEIRKEAITRFARAFELILSEANIAIVMIPHHPNDIPILDDVAREIGNPERVHVISELPNARQVKCITQHCEHVFSSRLHVALAALGVGTPVSCFPRKGKFEGQFEHFGLDEGVFPISTLPSSPDELRNLFLHRLSKNANDRNKIKAALPRLQSMASEAIV